MMKSSMRPVVTAITLLISFQVLQAQQQSLQDSLRVYFDEIRTAAAKHSTVWNHDLYGPVLFVQPTTRAVFANYADAAGALTQQGAIFSGYLPAEKNIANTALEWNGRRWAMVMLPLPANKKDRLNLMAHELFHRAQPSLGFRLTEAANNHLDQKNGRIYLRLELEALKNAINTPDAAQAMTHIKNAMIFRGYRYSLYPGSDSTENLLELNEGIAEYTGLMTSGRTNEEIRVHFNKSLADFLTNPGFVRSFAYQTIPMYGYLLQKTQQNWNLHISPTTNLRRFICNAFRITPAHFSAAYVQRLLLKYNGEGIVSEETARETRINLIIAGYKKKLMEEPHVEINAMRMNVSFDPRNMVPIENAGTVYPTITISDTWGILTATNGALISSDWTKISISAPTANDEKKITGEGWQLTLKEGFQMVKDGLTGNYTLVKK